MKMPNNLFSGIAGGLEGFSRQDPFGRGGIATGLSMTPLEKLWTGAEQEGASLSDVMKDLRSFGGYDLSDGRYLVNEHYANRPATAKYMNAVLEDYLNPPNFAKMSTKEQEEYRDNTLDMIMRTIEAAAARGGVIPEKPWEAMKPALAEKYTGEGALEERYMPFGFEKQTPETQARVFKGVTGKAEKPMTGGEMAEARRLGKPLGSYPLEWQEFQDNRGVLFDELSGSELEKSVMAMVSEGAEAAVMEPGWWMKQAGEKRTAAEVEQKRMVEKRHPFLKDKNAAKWLKVEADPETGLVDWTKFSSANIEGASWDDKLDAISYLYRLGGFTGDQMWWIFSNWFPGPGTPQQQPTRWGGLGGTALGGE